MALNMNELFGFDEDEKTQGAARQEAVSASEQSRNEYTDSCDDLGREYDEIDDSIDLMRQVY